jgi:5'-deoxynucleotidase YfbR-like HD superfamily hydrolase
MESNMYPTNDGRKGNWQQTYMGIRFYPLDPRPEDFVIEDIAHGLSNICRYNGHTREFYSVAEHCVLMSQCVSPEAAFLALMHDASEAYVCDVPKPLKLMLEGYEEIEYTVTKVIYEKFLGTDQFPREILKEVKRADVAIVANEAPKLMLHTIDWEFPEKPLDTEIYCWDPKTAKQKFLERYEELNVQA